MIPPVTEPDPEATAVASTEGNVQPTDTPNKDPEDTVPEEMVTNESFFDDLLGTEDQDDL